MNPDTHNPLPALRAEAEYGISRSAATHLQNNYWVVPDAYKHIFSTYYLLNWSTGYFKEAMVEGTVERTGTKYQVIYHRTNPAEIAKYKGNVMLSFRILKREFEVQAVVLVSLDKRGE